MDHILSICAMPCNVHFFSSVLDGGFKVSRDLRARIQHDRHSAVQERKNIAILKRKWGRAIRDHPKRKNEVSWSNTNSTKIYGRYIIAGNRSEAWHFYTLLSFIFVDRSWSIFMLFVLGFDFFCLQVVLQWRGNQDAEGIEAQLDWQKDQVSKLRVENGGTPHRATQSPFGFEIEDTPSCCDSSEACPGPSRPACPSFRQICPKYQESEKGRKHVDRGSDTKKKGVVMACEIKKSYWLCLILMI